MAFRSPTQTGLGTLPNAASPAASIDEMEGHTFWGRWATAAVLPNASGSAASGAAWAALRPGDWAFAEDIQSVCWLVSRGTSGGANAIWSPVPRNSFTGALADPTNTDDIGDGWSIGSRIRASSGKLWECLTATANAAVWACVNGPVPQADNASASITIADTDDGGQLWLTHATPAVAWPNTLRAGHTVELVAFGASTVITLTSGGGSNLIVLRPASRTLATVERYDAVTVTVRDGTNAIARGDLG